MIEKRIKFEGGGPRSMTCKGILREGKGVQRFQRREAQYLW